MSDKIQDQIYIVDGKLGKTSDICHTFSDSRYNAGGKHKLPTAVYFAVPMLPFPADKIEDIYNYKFYDFLLPKKGNFREKLEYINPVHTHITAKHIQEVIEDEIRQKGIRVRRLKSEFIKTIPINPNLAEDVRNNYDFYTEPV